MAATCNGRTTSWITGRRASRSHGRRSNGSGALWAQGFDESGGFGYLSRKDAALIRDALLCECDTFLTVERKLPRNADHLSSALGLEIMRPPEMWEVMRPYLGGL